MRRAARLVPPLAALAVGLACAAHASAQKTGAPARPPSAGSSVSSAPSPRLTTLPSLPSIARVRVETARDHVVVIEEVNLPRGDWQSGDLELYVAFGAPGAPQAFDAHLLAVADGALEPEVTDAGEPVAIERAARRPPNAQLLLGPAQMAGAILHVRDAAFRRAVAPGNMAALRVRTLLPLPEEDARTGREIVVRLGAWRGTPLTLGRLQIASHDARLHVTRAEAHLCGAEADPYPLAIAAPPRPVQAAPLASAPVAPVLAVRHATDDLCVRFWFD